MKEIKIENELGKKIYINGIPDLTLMPKEVFDSFIAALELQISESMKNSE